MRKINNVNLYDNVIYQYSRTRQALNAEASGRFDAVLSEVQSAGVRSVNLYPPTENDDVMRRYSRTAQALQDEPSGHNDAVLADASLTAEYRSSRTAQALHDESYGRNDAVFEDAFRTAEYRSSRTTRNVNADTPATQTAGKTTRKIHNVDLYRPTERGEDVILRYSRTAQALEPGKVHEVNLYRADNDDVIRSNSRTARALQSDTTARDAAFDGLAQKYFAANTENNVGGEGGKYES